VTFDKLKLEIITPERTLLSDTVDMVTVPTESGEVGILPNHIPLFSKIIPGEIHIKKGSEEKFVTIYGGFLEVSEGKINILADFAIYSDEIEEEKVHEAKIKAEEAMKNKKSETDFALAESELRKTILQLKIAERRKRKI
jgi:F-type H+-transporting ATPase subunit epsilon